MTRTRELHLSTSVRHQTRRGRRYWRKKPDVLRGVIITHEKATNVVSCDRPGIHCMLWRDNLLGRAAERNGRGSDAEYAEFPERRGGTRAAHPRRKWAPCGSAVAQLLRTLRRY